MIESYADADSRKFFILSKEGMTDQEVVDEYEARLGVLFEEMPKIKTTDPYFNFMEDWVTSEPSEEDKLSEGLAALLGKISKIKVCDPDFKFLEEKMEDKTIVPDSSSHDKLKSTRKVDDDMRIYLLAEQALEIDNAYSLAVYGKSLTHLADKQYSVETQAKLLRAQMEDPEAGVSELHALWMMNKMKDGWRFGNPEEGEKVFPWLLPFEVLPKALQERLEFMVRVRDALLSI